MSNILNLQKLEAFAATPPKLEAHPVPVPEFGAAAIAFIAELSADERDSRLEVSWNEHKERTGKDSNVHYRAWVAAACWCDAHRVFVAKAPEDIEAVADKLGALSAKPVTRMFAKAATLNALTPEDQEEAKKNLPPAADGSGGELSTPDTAPAAPG